jgi:hypothetical protein
MKTRCFGVGFLSMDSWLAEEALNPAQNHNQTSGNSGKGSLRVGHPLRRRFVLRVTPFFAP